MDHEETTTAEARGVRATFTVTDDRNEAVREADEFAVRREYVADEDAGVLRADTRYLAGGREVDEAREARSLSDDGERVAAADEPVEVVARQYHNDDPQGTSTGRESERSRYRRPREARPVFHVPNSAKLSGDFILGDIADTGHV